jgi:IS30 family transposase
MSRVYSHIGEEERQVIQIQVGNGATVRAIAAMLGRSASSISREIRRNTWFPSNQNESYRPYRPQRLKTGPWTGRYYVAGPAQRKADARRTRARKPRRMAATGFSRTSRTGCAGGGRPCSSRAGFAASTRTTR